MQQSSPNMSVAQTAKRGFPRALVLCQAAAPAIVACLTTPPSKTGPPSALDRNPIAIKANMQNPLPKAQSTCPARTRGMRHGNHDRLSLPTFQQPGQAAAVGTPSMSLIRRDLQLQPSVSNVARFRARRATLQFQQSRHRRSCASTYLSHGTRRYRPVTASAHPSRNTRTSLVATKHQ